MLYRFVQLSDIHFGQERDGTLVKHEDVRMHLLTDAASFADARGPANLVIVVGDIAYSGKTDEYKIAEEWLDRLTVAVKCDETDVCVVPGNHDCDRTQIRSVCRTVHRGIRAGTPKSAYAELEDMAKGPEEANPLLPKLKAYRAFAASYDSDFRSIASPSWTKNLALGAGITLQLVGMNSVQVCDNEDKPASMILGNAQYIFPEEPHIIHAVIMHHPLDWYMDKADAKPYLRNRARIVMVGHEHIPDISKTVDVLENQWLDIYSGATNPPEDAASYQFAYNWIEVQLEEKAEGYVLGVSVFPRVWIPEQTRFAADVQRLAGRESARFDISCPRTGPSIEATTSGTRTRTMVEAISASGVGPVGETTMNTKDDEAVAKLKFLCWRLVLWPP